MRERTSKEQTSRTAEEQRELTWDELLKYLDGGLRKAVKMVKTGAVLVGWLVKAGVRKIGELWAETKPKAEKAYKEWKPDETANKVARWLLPDIDKRNNLTIPVLALGAVALLSTGGYALVLSGAVHGGASIAVSMVSYCGHTLCSSDAVTLLRNQTHGIVPAILSFGTLLATINLRHNAIRSFAAPAEGLLCTTNGKRVWYGGRYAHKQYTAVRPHVVKAFRYVFPHRDANEPPRG